MDYIGPTAESLKELTDPKGKFKCREDGSDTSLICPPDIAGKITIKIQIINTGTKPVDAYALPKVADLSGLAASFDAKGSPMNIKAGESREATVDIEFAKQGKQVSSIRGRTYKIYPAAACISSFCKTTGSEGIYRANPDAAMTITFNS